MDEWVATVVLPNISVREPIEGGIAALVSSEDERVRVLCDGTPRLADFLVRFADAFGEEVAPAVLLSRSDAPTSFRTVEAIASVRDALALSVVGLNRAREIVRPRGHRICYANSFAFYPWMLDSHGEDLVAITPAFTAVHDVSAFRGQSAAELPVMPLSSFDAGRMIALGVGAFEILAHPGTQNSGLGKVYDLLEQVEWEYRRSSYRRYRCHGPKRGDRDRRPVACRLYSDLHKTRNAFLHGNPIAPSRLRLRGGGSNLFQIAAPLYRLALTGFLPVSAATSLPDSDDPEILGVAIAEPIDRSGYQKTIEEALLFAYGIGRSQTGP